MLHLWIAYLGWIENDIGFLVLNVDLNPVWHKKPSIGLKRKTFDIGNKLISKWLLTLICIESNNTSGKESKGASVLDKEIFAYKKLRLR